MTFILMQSSTFTNVSTSRILKEIRLNLTHLTFTSCNLCGSSCICVTDGGLCLQRYHEVARRTDVLRQLQERLRGRVSAGRTGLEPSYTTLLSARTSRFTIRKRLAELRLSFPGVAITFFSLFFCSEVVISA